MTSRAVLLLSAGLDSTVNLSLAVELVSVDLCLTFDYGQLAAVREIEMSKAITKHYKIDHLLIDLPFLKTYRSALTRTGGRPPAIDGEALNDNEKTAESAAAVWVPNRNGVFVNVAAAVAEDRQADLVIAGFNAEEATTFPDNSREFIDAANASLSFSTKGAVKLTSYTTDMDKASIVKLGLAKGAPLNLIWACYTGGERMCGRCESCRRTVRAFQSVDALDRLKGRIEAA